VGKSKNGLPGSLTCSDAFETTTGKLFSLPGKYAEAQLARGN